MSTMRPSPSYLKLKNSNSAMDKSNSLISSKGKCKGSNKTDKFLMDAISRMTNKNKSRPASLKSKVITFKACRKQQSKHGARKRQAQHVKFSL